MDQIVDRDELRRETERQQRELALLAERIRELTAELSESQGRNMGLIAELETARSETTALLSSTSWRMTGPLRTMVRILRQR